MSLTIVISTANERLLALRIPPLPKNFRCLVVHQVYSGSQSRVDFDCFLQNRTFDYERLNYSGLSKSRNFGLANVSTKYAFIMDDDVEFDVDKIQTLANWMERNNIDVATCRHKFEDGNYPRKYKDDPFKHDILSLAKVSSIDICINVEKMFAADLRFDEGFGLGTSLPSGEEYIFLTDCLKRNLNVWYYPITVGVHPNVTSGMDFYTSPDKTLAKREMFKRILGWKSGFFIFAFWLKKLPLTVKSGYFFAFTKTIFLGVRPSSR